MSTSKHFVEASMAIKRAALSDAVACICLIDSCSKSASDLLSLILAVTRSDARARAPKRCEDAAGQYLLAYVPPGLYWRKYHNTLYF